MGTGYPSPPPRPSFANESRSAGVRHVENREDLKDYEADRFLHETLKMGAELRRERKWPSAK